MVNNVVETGQITEWMDPKDTIRTAKGLVTCAEWAQREANRLGGTVEWGTAGERIGYKGVVISFDHRGKIAVFDDPKRVTQRLTAPIPATWFPSENKTYLDGLIAMA